VVGYVMHCSALIWFLTSAVGPHVRN
jgi:hypothetical protein